MTLSAETRCIEVTAYTGNDGGRNSSVIVSLTDPEVTANIVDADSIRVTDTDGNPLAFQVLDYTPGEWALIIVNIPNSDETNGDVIRFYTNADFGNADKVALTNFGEDASANIAADEFDYDITVYTHKAQNAGTNANELSVSNCKNFAHPCVRRARGWTRFKTDAAAAAGTVDYTHIYQDTPLPPSSITTPQEDPALENPVLFGITDESTFAVEEVPGGINPIASWPGNPRNDNFRNDGSCDYNPVDDILYVFDKRNVNDGASIGESDNQTIRRTKITAGSGGSWDGATVGTDESLGQVGTGELANASKSISLKFDANGRLHLFSVDGVTQTDRISWLYSDSQGDVGSWEDVGEVEMGGGNPPLAAWHQQVSDLIDGYYYLSFTEGREGELLNPSGARNARGGIRIFRISEDDFNNLRLDGWEECRYITAQQQGDESDWFGGGFYCPSVFQRTNGIIDILTSALPGTSHPDYNAGGLRFLVGRIADIDLSDNTPSTDQYWGRGWYDGIEDFDAELIFDFSEDGSLEDRSGNGRDLTLRNDPIGGGTGAAAFDAATDSILFDGLSVLDVGTDTWTRADDEFVMHIEFRVDEITSPSGTIDAQILGGMFFENSTIPYGLVVAVRDRATDTGKIVVGLRNASNATQVVTMVSGARVDDGEFHTVTLQRKTSTEIGTAFAERVKVLLDGEYIGFVNMTGSGNIGGTTGTPQFGIGGSIQARGSQTPWLWKPLGAGNVTGRIRRFEYYTKAPFEFITAPRSFDWDTANRADVPNVLQAVSLTPDNKTLKVNWTLSSSGDTATQVDIEHADNRHFNNSTTVQATASDGTATLTGLTNGTTRYVRVRPKNATEFSPWSASVSAEVGSVGPARRRGLRSHRTNRTARRLV